jgi:predicted enzyme related to lactoylglutathione lyase
MANKICHVELISKDIKQASEFYKSVFDWKVESWDDEYFMFNPGEGPGGGFSHPMAGKDHGTCVYIEVDDIDAMLKSIVDAGGKVLKEKTQISEEYGYFALFADPGGTLVGLWSKN